MVLSVVLVIYTLAFILMTLRDVLNTKQIRVMDELIRAQRKLIQDLELELLLPGKIQRKAVLSGGGAPSSDLGERGDFYLDVKGLVLYGPKTTNGWPTGQA